MGRAKGAVFECVQLHAVLLCVMGRAKGIVFQCIQWRAISLCVNGKAKGSVFFAFKRKVAPSFKKAAGCHKSSKNQATATPGHTAAATAVRGSCSNATGRASATWQTRDAAANGKRMEEKVAAQL